LTVEQEHVYYANGVLVENCLTFAMPVVRGDVAQGRWLPAAGWQA
jgi:hypothetical protein